MYSRRLGFFSCAFLFLNLLAGLTNIEGKGTNRNVLQTTSEEDSCNRPKSYLCDCEEVPADFYFNIKENFAQEKLECSPLNGGDKSTNCIPECDQVICYGALGVYQEICGTLLKRDIVTSIRNMKCGFDTSLLMHVCERDDKQLRVDVPTFKTVSEGYCVPGCGVEISGLNCTFSARFFGDPFILPEPPVEPPIEPPVEPPIEPPIEPPVEPPVEPPDDIASIPVPEPEEIEEIIIPPSEPPETAVIEIEIPIDQPVTASLENSIYYGPWSDCTAYCSENGQRFQRRTATCRNSFGVPLPLDQCDPSQEPDVVKECPFVTCVGEYYYVLGDWSACSQQCAVFTPETGTMSVGTRERELTCLFVNGTLTEPELCMDLIQAPELDLTSVCGSTPCSPVRYVMGPWGECSCQTESRIRTVTCVDLDNEEVEEQMCEALDIRRPSSIEYCFPRDCA